MFDDAEKLKAGDVRPILREICSTVARFIDHPDCKANMAGWIFDVAYELRGGVAKIDESLLTQGFSVVCFPCQLAITKVLAELGTKLIEREKEMKVGL